MNDLWNDRKLYDNRDPMEQGDWFVRHMHHLTTENLHSKAAIAEELAHRDIEIERLQAENERLRSVMEAIATECAATWVADRVREALK